MLSGITAEGQAALRRLRSAAVNYMELSVPAGAFSCGTCRFAEERGRLGFCHNREVQSLVNPQNGCCNLFEPAANVKLPPKQWAAFK